MKIILNGESRDIENGITLRALVDTLGGDPRSVAIELNREIVPKSNHASTKLQDGDQLEVVQFVGGG